MVGITRSKVTFFVFEQANEAQLFSHLQLVSWQNSLPQVSSCFGWFRIFDGLQHIFTLHIHSKLHLTPTLVWSGFQCFSSPFPIVKNMFSPIFPAIFPQKSPGTLWPWPPVANNSVPHCGACDVSAAPRRPRRWWQGTSTSSRAARCTGNCRGESWKTWRIAGSFWMLGG